VRTPQRSAASHKAGSSSSSSNTNSTDNDNTNDIDAYTLSLASAEPSQRYITGCQGDVVEAKRRWDLSVQWRKAEGINTILQEPQPHFDLIKEYYPHFFCGRAKSGNLVYCKSLFTAITSTGHIVSILLLYYYQYSLCMDNYCCCIAYSC
jgi:hypothetical protein